VCWSVPVIPGMAGSLKYRERGPGWPGKKVIPPPLKLTWTKQAAGVGQVTEHLPNKSEALSSNTSTKQKT
jgi:hypothetical protein